MLADLERARHPASSPSRRSRPAGCCCGGSGSRRGLQAARRALRRGSECRKSLHTPGSSCIPIRDRGRQNIFEQINTSTGTVEYLHHDQAGSTRLLTGSTGKTEATFTYGAYGELTGSTGTATTPLGYDAQYTNSDTGLIYLRAREYDPKTAQFLSVDPLAAISGAPYDYAGDNPLNRSDPTGLLFGISLPSWEEVGEGIAGWGDTITFGGTKWVREQIGDNNIDACSGAYQSGGIAGLVTGALIPGEDDAEAGELGVEGVDEGADFGSTPEGRSFTKHYGLETGPERNIPGSVVDQTINENPGVPGRDGTTVYYDPENDVTAVTGRNGGIVSARRGEP